MKKLSVFAVLFLLFLCSCEKDSTCKNCEAVTYDVKTGVEISRESAIEYCGSSLDDKENTTPIIVSGEKVVWECK